MARDKATIQQELERAKERLGAYMDRELEMLRGGVQSYGIGSRNVARYNMDLTAIRNAIKDLQNEIAQLEGELGSGAARKAVAVVPRDW